MKKDLKKRLQQANATLAAASRVKYGGDPEALKGARNEMLAARLAIAVDAALHPDPPYEPLARADRVELAERLTNG